MKNPHTRWFYTALGTRLTGEVPEPAPDGVPEEMLFAAGSRLPLPPRGRQFPGTGLSGNACRRIYGTTWEILRPLGFSRPGRFRPWPGVELFLPFVRGGVGVTPQGFSPRVPHRLRGLLLAGKASAAGILGIRMLVVCARVSPEAWELAARGGAWLCTPDTLLQALSELDFPGNTK